VALLTRIIEESSRPLLSREASLQNVIFNPVVEHWNKADKAREDAMKVDPSVLLLFYLTSNDDGTFLSFYSLHEATMGLYDHPERTAIVFDYNDMVPRAVDRLRKVCSDLRKRFPDAPLFESLADAENWLISKLA
jgi:hypothetical protein